VGAEFKQEDRNIYVVGRLKSAIQPGPLMPLLSVEPREEEVKVSSGDDGDEKRVVITPTAEPKKRKLKRKEPVDINEPAAEGIPKGTD